MIETSPLGIGLLPTPATLASHPTVVQLIELGLAEDLPAGDATTLAALNPAQTGHAVMKAREPLYVSGLTIAQAVFKRVDPSLEVQLEARDGDHLAAGTELLHVRGSLASILTAERLALNFVGRLAGIATHTARFVALVAGSNVRLVDTRKTTPGFRLLEKAAVRHGGGSNHRMNLSDGILIKDNHVASAGGVRQVIERARRNIPHHLIRIELEVDTLAQLREGLECGVEVIMLDNMTLEQLEAAVALNGGRALLEASGGVSLESVAAIARTGVDLISVGSLVHGARWVDIGLDIEEGGRIP